MLFVKGKEGVSVQQKAFKDLGIIIKKRKKCLWG